MIQAEIDGVGTLEFPDGTDPAVIQATVKKMVADQGAGPSGVSQFMSDLAGGAGRRIAAQGQNALDVVTAIATPPKWMPPRGTPSVPPLPGGTAIEKGLNVARLTPPWALAEWLLHVLAGAPGEAISKAMGNTPETAAQHGDLAELPAGILANLLPTGGSATAKALQMSGFGRPSKALRAEDLAARMKEAFPSRGPANIPLTFSDTLEQVADNPHAYDDLVSRFRIDPTGKQAKPDKVFKRLSNLPTIKEQAQAFDNAAAKKQIGSLSRGADAPPIPPEVQSVIDGDAPAFLMPPHAEGTIPTAGEQALAGVNLQKLARQTRMGYFKGKGGEVIFNPDMTKTSALKALDKQGKLADIVNGPGTSPKPQVPENAVIVKTPDGTEVRTILTDTPEKTAAAVQAQPAGTQVEVRPFEQAGDVLQQRMQGLRNTIDDARSSIPTGKQFYRDQEGNIVKTGNAGALLPRFEELFPEIRDLPPGTTPKQLVDAIDKDRGNKLYLQIQDAIKEQMAREAANPAAVAERPQDWTDYEAFSKAFDDVVNAPESVKPPTAAQPKLFQTQATMPPTPLQPKAPQVEHSDLLKGFEKPAPEPPRLPLSESGHTVELGMGLPVHRVGKAMKRVVQGFDDDTQPVRWFQSGRVQLNRVAPGQKLGDRTMNAITEERAWQGTSDQLLKESGLYTLTRQENLNLMQVQEGRATPMNAKVAKALNAINPEREKYSHGLQQVGAKVLVTKPTMDKTTGATGRMRFWKPYQPVKNYVPHLPDNRAIVKDGVDVIATEVQAWNRTLSSQDARHVAEVLLARAKGTPIPRTVPDQIIEFTGHGQPKSAHLHARTGLVIPDKYRLLPNEAWPAYFQSTSREIALARHLGPGDAAIEALRKTNAARPDDAIKEVLDTWDYWRGGAERSPSQRFMDKLIAVGRNLVTARFMGPTTAIKQGSQAIPIFAETKTTNFVKAIASSFKRGTRDEAARAGAHLDDLIRDMTEEHLALSEAMHPSQSALDKAVVGTERVASAVTRTAGITAHDRFWRTVGYKAALLDFQDFQQAAAKGNVKAISRLKEHGLTAASTPEQMQRAASAFSAKVNLQSDPIAMPAFIYKMPMFRLSTHLSRFAIGQQQRMVRDFAVPLAKAVANKDWATFQRHGLRATKLLTGGVVGGELLGDTLRTIAGRPDDRPGGTPQEVFNDLVNQRVPPKVLVQRIGDNIMFAAFLGYAQLAKEALYDPTTRDAKALRVGSLLLGPVGSSIVEGATRAANLATADTEKGVRSGKSDQDRAWEDVKRTVVGSLTGTGRVVSQWMFPHSQGSDKRRALNGIVQAMRRNDAAAAAEWQRWYERRQGTPLSYDAIGTAFTDYGD